MKLSILAAGIVALASAASVGAVTVDVHDGYTVTYDEGTILGTTSFSFSGGSGPVGFGWNLTSDINVVSLGSSESAVFNLPDFTITANPGYTLSGSLSGFLGNLVYNEVGSGATTSASATADVSVDLAGLISVGGSLDRVESVSIPSANVSSGYYGSTTTVPAGSFSSFSVSNFVLTLNASGGAYSSILAQPQNELSVSFFATPVPEPETYAMMLAGIGLIAAIARRRKHSGA